MSCNFPVDATAISFPACAIDHSSPIFKTTSLKDEVKEMMASGANQLKIKWQQLILKGENTLHVCLWVDIGIEGHFRDLGGLILMEELNFQSFQTTS